jgi:membrane-associated protein
MGSRPPEVALNAIVIPLLAALGPLAIFLLMAVAFAETGLLAGFFLPGDSMLFAAGVFIASSVINLPLWLVVAAVATAAVLGDQLGYIVGRRYGPRVLSRPRSRLLTPDHIHRAEKFVARHGEKAVVLARFVPVARTLTPVIAGVGHMPRRIFTFYNVLGGVAWTVVMLCAGYFLGGVPFVAHHVEAITIGIVTVSLLPAMLTLSRRHVRRLARIGRLERTWFVVTLVTATGVLVLADSVRENEGLSTLDPAATRTVVGDRSGSMTLLAHAWTWLGNEVTLAVLTGVVLLILVVRRRVHEAAVFAIGMAGSAALTVLIKHLVARARPGAADVLGPVDHSYSFPSGHTLNSAVFLGLLVWLLWPTLRSRTSQAAAVAAAVVLAGGVGASRVYLGFHWLTDVAAAWLLAGAWLSLLLLVATRIGTRGSPPSPPGQTPRPRPAPHETVVG